MSNYEEDTCRINGALWRRDKNGDWQPVEEPNEVAPGVDPKWTNHVDRLYKKLVYGKSPVTKEFESLEGTWEAGGREKVAEYEKKYEAKAEPQCDCNILNPCQDCLARWKEEKNCE